METAALCKPIQRSADLLRIPGTWVLTGLGKLLAVLGSFPQFRTASTTASHTSFWRFLECQSIEATLTQNGHLTHHEIPSVASLRPGGHFPRIGWPVSPEYALKKQIKVRTFADWDDLQPGFLEADLVAHCGVSAAGSFLHTLVLVDVATGWTECVALLRRSEADVIGALNSLRGRLPVPLLGLDTDNGSEFINYEMLRYCQREQITFTRSRVNRKNDQAFVEEKNGSVVRRLIGYDRYEGLGAWRALIHLYEILRLYVNFFQPSMKLIEKQREGARVKKRYDRAQTPYQRIIASGYLTKRKRERIESLYRKLDPVTLLKELEQRQDHFWTFANGQRELEGNDSPREMDAVVRKYLVEITASQEPNAIRRYRRTKKPRTWRTRKDPFAEVWPEVRVQLEVNPAQTAKALFVGLQQRYPGRFFNGQLRTLQRRVRDWRREALYKAEIARVEPTASEIGSQSRPVAPPEGRKTGLAPVALRAPSPRPVVSEVRS